MRTPTAVSAGRLARCLSLRSLAGLGRLVALLLGEAAPDAVDLPGPQRERETREPDRAARRSPSRRPPAPATCPWARSGRTDRDRRTGRRQAATTCRRQSAAPPRRVTGTAGRLPRHGASGEATPCAHHGQLERACVAALRAALHKHVGEPMRQTGTVCRRRCHRHASQRNPGRWQRLAGTSTCTAVRGRSVLRCCGRANHHDPVTPRHLPGGKPGSGPPPGRNFSSGLTGRARLGALPSRPCTSTPPAGELSRAPYLHHRLHRRTGPRRRRCPHQ